MYSYIKLNLLFLFHYDFLNSHRLYGGFVGSLNDLWVQVKLIINLNLINMENAGLNSESRSTSQVIEMVGSVVLLICLFLPWVTIRMGGQSIFGISYGTSYSAFEGMSLLYRGGNLMAGLTSSINFFALLCSFPLLCLVNPAVQYAKRIPWLPYYTAWIPVVAGMVLLYGVLEEQSSGFGGFGGISMGAGAVLSLLVGLVMQLSAWTTIGAHFREHRTYFFVALAWFLIGVAVYPILGNATDFWSSHPEGYMVLTVFAGIGASHFFFLIYGVIVAEVTPSPSVSPTLPKTSGQADADEFLNQVRTRTDDELKTILQHKEDYNERLVRAAKIIMLERISTPDPSAVLGSSAASETPPVETEDDKYKAYQPSASALVKEITEAEEQQSPAETNLDSFEAIRASWSTKGKVEDRKPEEIQPTEAQPDEAQSVVSAVHLSGNGRFVLYSVLAGILLAVGGVLVYFLWYTPYVKDRDASRTYVVANNVFLRSSRVSGIDDNILTKVPYGTEVITYNKLGDWAEVKVNKQEGVIASAYLLDS